MQRIDYLDASDLDLVNLARNGDKSAYGCLYERYIDQIYRYIYYRVSNQKDAEDLTEMVFLKTFEKIQNKSSLIENFQAWIYRSAQNLVIDHYRTSKNTTSLDEIVSIEDGGPPPETAVSKKENQNKLRQIINKLNKLHQQVIICRFINELSYEDTAKTLGLKPGNVRVIQLRALRKMRSLMNKERK